MASWKENDFVFDSKKITVSAGQFVSSYKNIALAQKQYDPGLMTGGQVSQNTLIRLELGLGFEYKIHSRLFGFIEPQFQFNMRRNNYGPNLDQIHTLSFKSGISILLN